MNEITSQLKTLRLPAMAQCWESLVETHKQAELSLEDGLQIMLQAEHDGRLANRNARLIKEAHFRYQASIQESLFDSSRGIDKTQVLSLSTGEYIRRGVPVVVTGAAGTGKSWLASALGYQACLSGYKTAYFGMQKLFEKIDMCRIDATLPKFFDKMAATDLLILDDFGMKVLDAGQILEFMELIEDRHQRKSTIIVSQLPVAEWYGILSANTTAADAILDRIVHTAHRFELKGDSLRKK